MCKNNKKTIIFILMVFITEIIYGYYTSYVKGIILSDAFSRTANAFYVLFVKPPRFASIGLVWNPLPSVLQLPFIAFSSLWRPMASSAIAAVIVNALMAAITAAVLLDTFRKFHCSKYFTTLAMVCYVFNPFIFSYGSNGMSEGIFFTFMVYSICKLTLWFRFGKSKELICIAFALVFLFFTRYEAIPFAAALGLAIILHLLFDQRERKYWLNSTISSRYFYVEGTMILVYTPMAYSILLWIIFNLIITGNPLYFLNSAYSNVSQSIFSSDFGGTADILFYVLQRSTPFIPVFISIFILRIIRKKVFTADFLGLCILVFTMIAFHFLMLKSGSSFGWLRFFSYCLPICVAFLPYEISETAPSLRKTAMFLTGVGLLTSFVLCYFALQNNDLAKEEHNLVISSETYRISDYINEHIDSNETIMMDAFLTNSIILNIKNTDQLIVSSSLNFEDCVSNPVKNKVDYILVPDTEGVGHLDAINSRYPDLYENGAEWCEEYVSFDGFKLFKVRY